MKVKMVVPVLFITFVTGCQMNFNKAMEDYNGTDSAKIRVLDRGVISGEFYEKSGDCYRSSGTRRLTSLFMLSLIGQADTSISSGKKINMIHPGHFGDASVNEYTIPAGKLMKITNRTEQDSYSGQVSFYENDVYFIPEAGHEYEISVDISKHNNMPVAPTVTDLSPDRDVTVDYGKIIFCH